MALVLTAWIGRVVRRVVTVGVLALVLVGIVASPAAANQRGDAVTAANDFIYGCTYNGGDISGTASTKDSIVVVCFHETGRSQQCQWSAANGWQRKCWWYDSEVRSPDGAGRGVESGETIYQAHADSGAPNDGDLGANAHGEGKDAGKHHKHKAKDHGKKHGKSKGHDKGGQRK